MNSSGNNTDTTRLHALATVASQEGYLPAKKPDHHDPLLILAEAASWVFAGPSSEEGREKQEVDENARGEKTICHTTETDCVSRQQ
ncbi:hypothetical protein VTH82DRAFT_8634 [Thermothelomyces myriococcoides]